MKEHATFLAAGAFLTFLALAPALAKWEFFEHAEQHVTANAETVLAAEFDPH